MLLKNSARESKKGDKMKPRWNGPYKIHADLGKGVYRLLNPKTGNVLKKAVNIAQLKVYYSEMSEPPPPNSPPPNSPPPNSPPPNSPPHNSPPPNSPPPNSPPAEKPSPPSPIIVDEHAPTPEKVRNPAWIKSLQLFKSDQDVLIHGKELTDALIDAAQNLLRKNYPCINGLQPPSLAPLLQFNPTPTQAVQIHHTGKSA